MSGRFFSTPISFGRWVRAADNAALFFWQVSMVAQRTYVYIDGFNLYYRCLRKTPHKWLDLSRLCEHLLPPDKHQILKIKYFTARVQSRPYDVDAPTRQNAYLLALQSHIRHLEIIYGQFLSHPVRRPLAPPKSGMVDIIHTEEKGTDVNLAVHLLNDAWRDEYECGVVISNDSDLAEAMRLAKDRNKIIGWLAPGGNCLSHTLKDIPHFIKIIRAKNLAASQLPPVIPGTNIHKPEKW
jgi:uncharacterized LabA/DUF88 family protein